MAPELARLGHIALETPDLADSMEFFHDAVGMEEVERTADTVYLRAMDEFSHHSLSLTERDSAGVAHIGWQTAEPEHVELYAERLTEMGVDVRWVDEDEERGQGDAIRFEVPHGHTFELYFEMEKPDPPDERRSRLRNRTYSPTKTNPVAPRQIDHVQIWDPNARDCAEWLQEHLDFEMHERYNLEDGSRWGTFLSASGTKIEAAVIQNESGQAPPAVHHTAYTVDGGADLFEAGDAMKEHQVPIDGFGQHSISRGKFLYARDTTTGHRIEFNDGGYLVFDPDWDPIEWEETDLDDRQWLGGLTPGDAVHY